MSKHSRLLALASILPAGILHQVFIYINFLLWDRPQVMLLLKNPVFKNSSYIKNRIINTGACIDIHTVKRTTISLFCNFPPSGIKIAGIFKS